MTTISKSRYLKGRQCLRRLWLTAHGVVEPELEEEDVWEERIREGAQVESYAERAFPEAVRIGDQEEDTLDGSRREELLEATGRALELGRPIFQAVLEAKGSSAIIDILEPRGKDWFLWEVKASTYKPDAWTPVHDWDLAFQVHTARAAGVRVIGSGVRMLNKDFVLNSEVVDADELIVAVDRSSVVDALVPQVEVELRAMKAALGESRVPSENPGARCKQSRKGKDGRRASDCGHLTSEGYCGRDLPTYWAGRLPRLAGAKADYVSQSPGLAVGDLDPDDVQHKWTVDQRRAIAAVRSARAQVAPDALRRELRRIEWPVSYLDFEFDPGIAVPRFRGCRPYDSLPFQWALVIQERPGGPLGEPHSFLHLEDSDPSRPFAESLLGALPPSGSIVAHHQSAETTVLNRLAERLEGEVASPLRGLVPRFRDTEVIARAGYYHPDQQGSWSIKKLAPVLVQRGYDDLEIGHGMAAVMAWRQAIDPGCTVEEREQLRESLLLYCGRDAELMHGILERLRELADA